MFQNMVTPVQGGGVELKYTKLASQSVVDSWTLYTINEILEIIAIFVMATNVTDGRPNCFWVDFNGTILLNNDAGSSSSYGIRNVSGNTFELKYVSSTKDIYIIGY